jgi:hypothetical protein
VWAMTSTQRRDQLPRGFSRSRAQGRASPYCERGPERSATCYGTSCCTICRCATWQLAISRFVICQHGQTGQEPFLGLLPESSLPAHSSKSRPHSRIRGHIDRTDGSTWCSRPTQGEPTQNHNPMRCGSQDTPLQANSRKQNFARPRIRRFWLPRKVSYPARAS